MSILYNITKNILSVLPRYVETEFRSESILLSEKRKCVNFDSDALFCFAFGPEVPGLQSL